MTEFLGGVSL